MSTSNHNTNGLVLKMFPEEFNRLNREIAHHPVLMERLANHPSDEFEIRLAEIATYCEIILDGVYEEHQQIELARILERRLYNMRPAGSIILIT